MNKSGRTGWLKGLSIIVVVGLVGYMAWGYFFSSSTNAPHFLFVPVSHGDIEKSIVATGQLEPKQYVVVGAQVSGQVEKIHVEEGDVVEGGALLVEIDATVFETQVQNAEAALEAKKAQLAQLRAERELAVLREKRNNELFEKNAVSEDVAISGRIDVKVLDAQITASIAQIKADEASLAGDKATLGFAKIYAPISGTVASISVREGQTLNANQNAPELLQISDLTTMTLRAEVSEADVDNIKKGMPVYFSTLGNTDKRYHSTVRQVLPTPTEVNDVVLYQVLIDIENPDGALMDSMTTQVFFVEEKRTDTKTVPLAAVKGPPHRAFVLLKQGDEVVRTPVKTGIRNRTDIEILSGIEVGDEVVAGQLSPAGQQGANESRRMPGMNGTRMPRGPRGSA
ncbi:efflux RND transporter periplasmic adaptor subunit [Alteromonas sp. 14N.309.X.WAT.G.H12]|uniref:efflux RND transporter periplasmic adaptor subunit n=1 Tax=Alteromonas sp. 14N.309.X.WAT.G.H12 TaxID=3120824 RepID=UPI002FD37820